MYVCVCLCKVIDSTTDKQRKKKTDNMRRVACFVLAVMLTAVIVCGIDTYDAVRTENATTTTTVLPDAANANDSVCTAPPKVSSSSEPYTYQFQITPHGIEIESSLIVELNSDNFYSYVFPQLSANVSSHDGISQSSNATVEREAWFIFVYAPWCRHCKYAAPHLINASRFLYLVRQPHARVGILNSDKNDDLVKRLGVHGFPTMIYTTGQGKRWYEYRSSRDLTYLIRFLPHLYNVAKIKSSVINASDPESFKQFEENTRVEDATGAKRSRFFYVFVPRSGPSVNMTPENQHLTQWSAVLDSMVGMDSARVAAIYERYLPPAAMHDNAAGAHAKGSVVPEKATRLGSSMVRFGFDEVVRAARECVARNLTRSTEGVVLLATSDRLPHPTCYRGWWTVRPSTEPALHRYTSTEDEVQQGTIDESDLLHFRPHTDLSTFIHDNKMSAISQVALNRLMFSNDGSTSYYLGLLVLSSNAQQSTNEQYVSAMHAIVQRINERLANQSVGAPIPTLTASSLTSTSSPSITWMYAEDASDLAVLNYLSLNPAQNLPAVVIVDLTYNHFYKISTQVPRFEAIKDLHEAWHEGGEAAELIEMFTRNVLMKKYWSEKSSWLSRIAEALTMIPGLGKLHRLMDRDDMMFVCLVLGLTVAALFLFMAIMVEITFGSRGDASESAKKKKSE